MPPASASAICACSAPITPTTGPSTPSVAQLAARSGRSGKTARRLGAPPQKPPTWPPVPVTAALINGRPRSWHRSDSM